MESQGFIFLGGGRSWKVREIPFSLKYFAKSKKILACGGLFSSLRSEIPFCLLYFSIPVHCTAFDKDSYFVPVLHFICIMYSCDRYNENLTPVLGQGKNYVFHRISQGKKGLFNTFWSGKVRENFIS